VRLAKHAAHMYVTRIVYFVEEPEVKRPLEISRLLLEDNTKIPLREKL
jgi:hypothetical protein